jgi:hypothetical protein
VSKRLFAILTAAAFAIGAAAPALADCGVPHQSAKATTVTAQGSSAPTTPAPQTPIPDPGG